ncbi:hypothetical protein INR49_006442 [Caranx melampygus]|nr:hypothetical protein INR49_006442 [Caranx melampygus]
MRTRPDQVHARPDQTRPRQARPGARQTRPDHVRPDQTRCTPDQTTSDQTRSKSDQTRPRQTRPGPPQTRIRHLVLLHLKTMHCGYLLPSLLGLWVGLVAGGVLRDAAAHVEVQSIIEDLQAALRVYSDKLQETSSVRILSAPPCNHNAAHLNQSNTLVHRLSFYQSCAGRLRALCPDVTALCRVITLNQDLLQHLVGSHRDLAGCPSPRSTPPPPDYNSMIESVQCVQCWRQQVAALHRWMTDSVS